jgi:hypothetical protein
MPLSIYGIYTSNTRQCQKIEGCEGTRKYLHLTKVTNSQKQMT